MIINVPDRREDSEESIEPHAKRAKQKKGTVPVDSPKTVDLPVMFGEEDLPWMHDIPKRTMADVDPCCIQDIVASVWQAGADAGVLVHGWHMLKSIKLRCHGTSPTC